QAAGGDGGEALHQGDARAVGEDVAHAVHEAGGLGLDGGDDVGVGVADEGDAEGAGEVDEAVAVEVPDVAADGAVPDDRVLADPAGLALARAAGGEAGGLVAGEDVDGGLALRAGDGGDEGGQLEARGVAGGDHGPDLAHPRA